MRDVVCGSSLPHGRGTAQQQLYSILLPILVCLSAVDQSSRQARDFALAYAQPWASLLQLFGGVPLVDRCVAGWIRPQQELYSSCWLRYLPGCGSAVARQRSDSPLAGYGKVQHWVATGHWLGHICASCNEPPCTI